MSNNVYEIYTDIVNKWKGANTSDTQFNDMVFSAINSAVEYISTHQNYNFLQGLGSIATTNGEWEYRVGSPPPLTACTSADSGSAGNPDGTYRYMVTYVNAFGESNPSPVSDSLTVTTNQVSLTAIPTADARQVVTSRKIYRNKNGTNNVFYLLTTIADNTTLTYTDNTADASLGAKLTYAKVVKPLAYQFQATTPSFMRTLKYSTFRKLRPKDDSDSGAPKYGIILDTRLYVYPVPDAVYTLNFPYYFKWQKVYKESDGLPEQCPKHVIFDYVEAQVLQYLNKENRFYNQSWERFLRGLDQLDTDYIRNKPPIKIISEDEQAANYETAFPDPDKNWYEDS